VAFVHVFPLMQSPPRSEIVFHTEQNQSRDLSGHQGGVVDDPVEVPVPIGVIHRTCTQHETTDVFSVIPRRIMGTRILPDMKWGKCGDECVICLEPMTSQQDVTDLPPCSHTYISPPLFQPR
jgi:hypothetical protein